MLLRIKCTVLPFFTAILLSGCVLQTISDDVTLNDGPEDDRGYIKDYDAASRDVKVVDNFETRFHLTATYLSPEFRASFARRFEHLYNAPQPLLEEASNKMGFFVTIFSPDRDGHDLTSDQLWTIVLKTSDRSHKPILIRKLDKKARWRPFFPAVNQWSEEYLVLFDTPSISIDPKLVGKGNILLFLANSEAKVELKW